MVVPTNNDPWMVAYSARSDGKNASDVAFSNAPLRGLVVEALASDHSIVRDQALSVCPDGLLGRGSVMVAPIAPAGKPMGVLVLLAAEEDFFDTDEVRLVEELAGDIAFAIDYLAKGDKLHYVLHHDVLTDMPNRHQFSEALEQLVKMARGNEVVLVALAVDRLAEITDMFGVPAGDDLIKEASSRLRAALSPSDVCASFGAGVFAVAFPETSSDVEVGRALEGTTRAVAGSYVIDGKPITLGCRAGVALFPNDAATPEALVRNAETALHKARELNEAYLFYSPDMKKRVAQRLSLEDRLMRSIDAQQFRVYYQPKIDAKSNALSGLEALIRWNDPKEGIIEPCHFIPALEESGLIVHVGRWVLERAMADHRAWVEQGLNPPRIAVNVSNIELKRQSFVNEVLKMQSSLPFRWLDLEITESMLMNDVESGIEKIKALAQAGISVAIDDFGTGYSSLSYVVRLPVAALKIDKSFIANMTDSPSNMAIVSSVIALAHSLGLKVIAEGVESAEQAKMLRLLQCDELQGYLFGRPVPADEVARLMATPTQVGKAPR